MKKPALKLLAASITLALSHTATAGTDVFFNPLTQSAAVASPNHVNELFSPWQAPAGVSQELLLSLHTVEAQIEQSIVRVPGLGSGASMFDMVAFDDTGRFIFIPHETQNGAGVTRYDVDGDFAEVLFSGDTDGKNGDWSNDFGAFDPSLYTPNGTVMAGEEWSGQGRIVEILNPMADADDIEIRELTSIPNTSHEGLRFSHDGGTLYFVDENNSGSLYKIVFTDPSDYAAGGQTFVLKTDAFNGDASANWNTFTQEERVGAAHWVALTDTAGNPLTVQDPYDNSGGPGNQAGRVAADEVQATPYGRPEDMEVATHRSGDEMVFFSATSENAVYSVQTLPDGSAFVRLAAKHGITPYNLDYPPTTGRLNSPDNLAQDALGNIYVIEDAPNGSDVGGDIWFLRDADNDGEAESLDHFLSIQVDGAEATGMIFNPTRPTEFVVAVQHPDSTNLDNVEDGFGDALWRFDLSNVVAPPCPDIADDDHHGHKGEGKRRKGSKGSRTCEQRQDATFVRMLNKANR